MGFPTINARLPITGQLKKYSNIKFIEREDLGWNSPTLLEPANAGEFQLSSIALSVQSVVIHEF